MVLNLKDAEIAAVVDTVAELTGKTFIVDPRVKGKMTIVATRSMSPGEIYQVFLSALDVHGFSAVQVGRVIKILPNTSAKQDVQPLASDNQPGSGDEVVTRVVELSHVSATQLVPILRPLLPQQGHLAAYVPSNILIISDRAGNIERLVRIIRRIDTPTSEDVEMIRLQHASATEVVRILTSVRQQGAAPGGPQAEPDAAVMIADERTNSILLGGGRSGRVQMRALINHLDMPLETEGNTKVVYLRYARAKDLMPVLTGVSSSVEQEAKAKGGAAASKDSRVDIQADESTNSLVITAPPDLFRSLDSVIKQLDVRRAQVQVETIIAEVSENLSAELGVQWAFDGTPGGKGPVGLINFGSSQGGGIADMGGAIALGRMPSIGTGMTLGIGTFNSGNINFAAILRALKGDGMTNILSTPTLVTLDNEEAEIVVGQTVPFVTGTYTSTGGSSVPTNPFNTVKRENVGITLKVKPQINEGDAVKLDLHQTVDSLSNSSTGAVDLITNTRSIKTSVIVDDGRIVVLGGLIEDSAGETAQKVPLLGDIPLLGALFRSKATNSGKKNLMVFMRPTIIRDASVASQLTSVKYNFIRAQELRARARGMMLIPDDRSPVLPALDDSLAAPPGPPPLPASSRHGG